MSKELPPCAKPLTRRAALSALAGACTAWMMKTASAATVLLKGVRYSNSAERSRFVFDLDAPVKHRVSLLDNPERVVIDLEGVKNAAGKPRLTADKRVNRMRFGVQGGENLRVVLDTTMRLRPRTMLMQPSDGRGYRLVLDLYEKPTPAPESSQPPARGQRDVIVAIDAGHGGKDPGAIGPSGVREKDVVLAIARKLERLFAAERGVKAVMIRDRDVFVPLRQRLKLASQAKADIFVSIHADAVERRGASGASAYIVSSKGASSEAAKLLASRENAADLRGGVSIRERDDMLASVLLNLYQSAAIDASQKLAVQVLAELGQINKLHKPSVGRAPFAVLKSPDIPSVLVETAFISNPTEEQKLASTAYQHSLATAIQRGVMGYLRTGAPRGTWLYALRG